MDVQNTNKLAIGAGLNNAKFGVRGTKQLLCSPRFFCSTAYMSQVYDTTTDNAISSITQRYLRV